MNAPYTIKIQVKPNRYARPSAQWKTDWYKFEHTLPRNELLCQLFWGHRYQWISHKMNIRHPGQLKKI